MAEAAADRRGPGEGIATTMPHATHVTNAVILLALASATLAASSSASAQCLTSECDIGGNCVGTNVLNPVNSCEQCRAQINKTTWTPISNSDPCDDGLYCTVADSCSGGACSGLPRGCTDFATCSDDSCDEAADTCRFIIQAGHCLIGGVCMTTGTLAAGNPCWICDPLRGTSVFAMNEGASCDDGRYCTVGDTCDAQAECVVVSQRSCDDRLACTSDLCDEAGDTCAHTVALDHCVADGHCRDNGEVNPEQACEVCDPEASDSSWSLSPEGTACGQAACSAGILTPPAACDGAGECAAATTESCPSERCADAFTCLGPCDADADCPPAAFCHEGACRNDRSLGASCNHPGQCLSDDCADGVCCERACDDLCEACDAAGSCEPHERETDPDDECPGDVDCNGARACHAAPGSEDAGGPDREVDASGPSDPEPQGSADAAIDDDAGGRRGDGGGGCSSTAAAGADFDRTWLVLLWASALVTRRRRPSFSRP